jgi:hypothetical protein
VGTYAVKEKCTYHTVNEELRCFFCFCCLVWVDGSVEWVLQSCCDAIRSGVEQAEALCLVSVLCLCISVGLWFRSDVFLLGQREGSDCLLGSLLFGYNISFKQTNILSLWYTIQKWKLFFKQKPNDIHMNVFGIYAWHLWQANIDTIHFKSTWKNIILHFILNKNT